MPDPETKRRAAKDKREGKSPSTQAGEFVREEIHHIREGKHGARSTKQAIAIGLSKARRSGVKMGTPKNASAQVKAQAARDDEKGKHPGRKVSPRRSRATMRALEEEPHAAASHQALSRHSRQVARRKKRTR